MNKIRQWSSGQWGRNLNSSKLSRKFSGKLLPLWVILLGDLVKISFCKGLQNWVKLWEKRWNLLTDCSRIYYVFSDVTPHFQTTSKVSSQTIKFFRKNLYLYIISFLLGCKNKISIHALLPIHPIRSRNSTTIKSQRAAPISLLPMHDRYKWPPTPIPYRRARRKTKSAREKPKDNGLKSGGYTQRWWFSRDAPRGNTALYWLIFSEARERRERVSR